MSGIVVQLWSNKFKAVFYKGSHLCRSLQPAQGDVLLEITPKKLEKGSEDFLHLPIEDTDGTPIEDSRRQTHLSNYRTCSIQVQATFDTVCYFAACPLQWCHHVCDGMTQAESDCRSLVLTSSERGPNSRMYRGSRCRRLIWVENNLCESQLSGKTHARRHKRQNTDEVKQRNCPQHRPGIVLSQAIVSNNGIFAKSCIPANLQIHKEVTTNT